MTVLVLSPEMDLTVDRVIADLLGKRTTVIEWKPRAEALAAELSEVGAVRDPAWWAAFAATPRHVFVPPGSMPGTSTASRGPWSPETTRPSGRPGWRRSTVTRCW